MKNQVKEKYLAPQIEVIQMETEGTSCVIAGSGNLGGSVSYTHLYLPGIHSGHPYMPIGSRHYIAPHEVYLQNHHH